jgi:phosphatidylserine/phosphatidylglycerophosphate/cardiolipin synthase-like enzyme
MPNPAAPAPRPLVFETDAGRVQSVVPGTPPVRPRSFRRLRAGRHLVQSLRTAPPFVYDARALPMLRVAPLAFAPGGLYEIHAALRKAILSAQRYLYIEDQYFWSIEALQWISQALHSQPGLKVVLVTGDFQPPGPPLPEGMPVALLDGLLPGLGPDEIGRIAFLQRTGFVHAKTVLVDDHWAMIGSANLARRSHFTDIEHALAVVDPDQQILQVYRAALWARHFELPAGRRGMPSDLGQALGWWDPAWHPGATGDRPAPRFIRIRMEQLARPNIDPAWYDLIADPDARKPWYFPWIGEAPRF